VTGKLTCAAIRVNLLIFYFSTYVVLDSTSVPLITKAVKLIFTKNLAENLPKNNPKNMSLIKSLKISWLSPQRINQLSFGNVTSHKLINIRTFKPEPGGLFDPRIFGPFLNYECYCGKYKGKENKGQKCERCEVLIAEKNLQR
jgi:hypothetical protein